jgi:hypothetical protein
MASLLERPTLLQSFIKAVVREAEAYLASQETRSSVKDERGETNDEPAGRHTTYREMFEGKTRPQFLDLAASG